MTLYASALSHLIHMAGNPGFRQHAIHRAAELDACSTGQWRGIAMALNTEIATRKAAALSARRAAGSSNEQKFHGT